MSVTLVNGDFNQKWIFVPSTNLDFASTERSVIRNMKTEFVKKKIVGAKNVSSVIQRVVNTSNQIENVNLAKIVDILMKIMTGTSSMI